MDGNPKASFLRGKAINNVLTNILKNIVWKYKIKWYFSCTKPIIMSKFNQEETFSHESFGQILFSRIQCNPAQKFYGSELEQSHYIQMTITGSQVIKELSSERYFENGKVLARVRMSSGQFAELITSLNYGSGVPCTVEVIDGKRKMPLPEQESKKEFVHRKFQERMSAFADTIREKQIAAKQLVKKKTLSKQDIHDLNMHLEWLTGEIERNIPFFAQCFQENMDDVVFEAKTEVENAIQHKLSVLGLEELHKQQNLLTDNNQ